MSLQTFEMRDTQGNLLPPPKPKLVREIAKHGMTLETKCDLERGGMDNDRYNEVRAIAYAKWLAARDGIKLPTLECRVTWSGFYSKTRTRARKHWDGNITHPAVYCRRIESVTWGRDVDQYNTRKDGRRGAWIGKTWEVELAIGIPNWDFEPQVVEE